MFRKRKLEESSVREEDASSDDDSEQTPCSEDNCCPATSSNTSGKKRVRFDGVTLYYFQRSQGFSCVPSSGGSTLGMSDRHHSRRELSISEHIEEQLIGRTTQMNAAHARRQELLARISNGEQPGTSNADMERDDEETSSEEDAGGSNQACEESATGAGEFEGDSAAVPLEDEVMTDASDLFPQPLTINQRRELLKASGIARIDRAESSECREIRKSRETCGCDCHPQCLPSTCSCALNEIKCQVDQLSFPCACSRNGCQNPIGRVEFNALRVRSHYFNTIMRLRMEERLERQGRGGTPPPKRIRFEPDDNSYCDQIRIANSSSICDQIRIPNSNSYCDQIRIAAEMKFETPPRKIGRVETEFQPQLDQFWTMHAGTSSAVAATAPIPNFESAFAPAVRQDSYDAFMRRLYGTTSTGAIGAAAAVMSGVGSSANWANSVANECGDRRIGAGAAAESERDPGNISLDSGYDEDGSSGTSTASTTLLGDLALDETFALPNVEAEEDGEEVEEEEEEDEESTAADALGDVLAQSIISDTV